MTVQVAGALTPVAELLDRPIPDIVTVLAARRRAKRRDAVVAERGLMLTPLVLLAACGGGGGGGGPTLPPPPPPAPTITGQADAIAITAGAAPATGSVLSNDTTTSGTLTVSAVAAAGGTAGQVGTPMTGALGALTINADGTYSFAVAANDAVRALGAGQTGTNTFTYTPSVGSTAGTPQTVTVTVTGVNDAPVAAADSASIAEDGATSTVTGNVRSNDTDPDANATLTVTAVSGGTVGAAVAGTYGSVVINSDGSFTYTLNNADPDTQALNDGQTAAETFTYTITDDQGATSTAMLTINIAGKTDVGVASGALGQAGVTLTAAGGFGFALGTLQPGQTGNVDGQGGDDLVVGAPSANGAGAVYVISFSGTGATVIRTYSGAAGDRYGYDVSTGNIGGAGTADVLIGAPGASANTGAVYGFYDNGTAANFTINTPAEAGAAAFPGSGDLGGNLGAFVGILGNVNGGTSGADFFFAMPGRGAADIGKAYVALGPSSDGTAAASAYEGAGKGYSVVPTGTAADSYGYRSAASGDFNKAGGNDLVLGDPVAGKVAVRYSGVPGSASTDQSDLRDANDNGFVLTSSVANSRLGESVAVGDVNGDGFADIIIGAPGVNKVYILLGESDAGFDARFGDAIDVATSSAPTIIEIAGTGGFGTSVAFLGDFNRDGLGDFAVGAPGEGNGTAYVMLGAATLTDATYSTATADADVIRLTGGVAGTGREVAGPGDVNNDGFADVAIGAAAASGEGGGTVYVVYGRSGQSGNSVGQEPVSATGLVDDGSPDLFGGSSASSDVVIDPVVTSQDPLFNDLYV
jgi:VCBS repeat-containing protein